MSDCQKCQRPLYECACDALSVPEPVKAAQVAEPDDVRTARQRLEAKLVAARDAPIGKRRMKETIHHNSCPKALAWDIPNVPCECPKGWPRWKEKP